MRSYSPQQHAHSTMPWHHMDCHLALDTSLSVPTLLPGTIPHDLQYQLAAGTAVQVYAWGAASGFRVSVNINTALLWTLLKSNSLHYASQCACMQLRRMGLNKRTMAAELVLRGPVYKEHERLMATSGP
jgi:hypothetical protein